ncbi:uncharacterized protein FOMMEDRAFT_160419 [Fomitiporia mediterranea MF3/22]|uniref:uncharacterized protein n=1 Tax=Fomitiporia mediterranea (strain MF3/22) TaxID=694068 RepID=UPI0004407BAA|nr:uncharacterized protein FOMMEDRAFT_160419 [Fomitiporia mediterranea MF3/22]EJC99396.1 hypothetical protein FOMMEDRAFT_160419 [Fomitiporia mediterranea MF3/22]
MRQVFGGFRLTRRVQAQGVTKKRKFSGGEKEVTDVAGRQAFGACTKEQGRSGRKRSERCQVNESNEPVKRVQRNARCTPIRWTVPGRRKKGTEDGGKFPPGEVLQAEGVVESNLDWNAQTNARGGPRARNNVRGPELRSIQLSGNAGIGDVDRGFRPSTTHACPPDLHRLHTLSPCGNSHFICCPPHSCSPSEHEGPLSAERRIESVEEAVVLFASEFEFEFASAFVSGFAYTSESKSKSKSCSESVMQEEQKNQEGQDIDICNIISNGRRLPTRNATPRPCPEYVQIKIRVGEVRNSGERSACNDDATYAPKLEKTPKSGTGSFPNAIGAIAEQGQVQHMHMIVRRSIVSRT